MGYKLVRHIDGVDYNAKLFYLDNGKIDLPPIENRTDILPGSEAHDIKTKNMWVLNSNYEWIPCPWKTGGGSGGGIEDAPTDVIGAQYARETLEDGTNAWRKVKGGGGSAIEKHSVAEWLGLTVKPDYSEITDSPFDGQVNDMYIDH